MEMDPTLLKGVSTKELLKELYSRGGIERITAKTSVPVYTGSVSAEAEGMVRRHLGKMIGAQLGACKNLRSVTIKPKEDGVLENTVSMEVFVAITPKAAGMKK